LNGYRRYFSGRKAAGYGSLPLTSSNVQVKSDLNRTVFSSYAFGVYTWKILPSYLL